MSTKSLSSANAAPKAEPSARFHVRSRWATRPLATSVGSVERCDRGRRRGRVRGGGHRRVPSPVAGTHAGYPAAWAPPADEAQAGREQEGEPDPEADQPEAEQPAELASGDARARGAGEGEQCGPDRGQPLERAGRDAGGDAGSSQAEERDRDEQLEDR